VSAASTSEVLYVIGTYPLVTTTFIDREIASLRRLGVPVGIVAVRRPDEETPLSAEQRALAQEVVYLLPVRASTLLTSHATFLARHPARYLRVFAQLVGARHPGTRARLKTVLHFGEGVVAAYLVRPRKPRELYAHFTDRAATIALVASRLLGVSYSLSVHAGADIFVERVLLAEKIRGARRVVTCTAHNRARIAAEVGAGLAGAIAVFPHGLDIATYGAPARTCDMPMILSVGQLQPRKGLSYLVRACGILRDRGYQFTCRIIGGGPQHAELQQLVHELGLDATVELLGAMPHERVIDHYREASMFVLAAMEAENGDADGFPNVLAEAMAANVPIVSTALPAIEEFVVDGQSGLLVAPGSAEEIAAAVGRLFHDPELRISLCMRARRDVAGRFDVHANVRTLRDALWPDVGVGHYMEKEDVT
jgi:glycosyltransferase involved in cell wall biosynthesis